MDTHKYIITARSSLRRGQKKKKKNNRGYSMPFGIFWNRGNRAPVLENEVFGSEMIMTTMMMMMMMMMMGEKRFQNSLEWKIEKIISQRKILFPLLLLIDQVF